MYDALTVRSYMCIHKVLVNCYCCHFTSIRIHTCTCTSPLDALASENCFELWSVIKFSSRNRIDKSETQFQRKITYYPKNTRTHKRYSECARKEGWQHAYDKVVSVCSLCTTNMLDPITNEIIYASNGCDEIAHEPDEETATATTASGTPTTATDDNNRHSSNIRRRKGKIISCAKETIEQGKQTNDWHIFHLFPYCLFQSKKIFCTSFESDWDSAILKEIWKSKDTKESNFKQNCFEPKRHRQVLCSFHVHVSCRWSVWTKMRINVEVVCWLWFIIHEQL